MADRARADPARSRAQDPLTLLIVTLGLFILVNALAGWIWGFDNRGFPRAFAGRQRGRRRRRAGLRVARDRRRAARRSSGCCACCSSSTKLGLAMRAAAANPASSRLVGINVGRMLMLGWGLAALLGALAGVLVAPQLFLDVNLMGGVLVYSFAAATLGGFDSPERRGASAAGSSASPRRWPASYVGFIGSGPEDPRAAGDHLRRAARAPERPVRLAGGGARVTLLSVERDSPRHRRSRAGSRCSCWRVALPFFFSPYRVVAVHARAGLRGRRARAQPAGRLQRARSRSATARSSRSARTPRAILLDRTAAAATC